MHILLEGLPDVVATQDASEVCSAAEEPVKFLAQNVAWRYHEITFMGVLMYVFLS